MVWATHPFGSFLTPLGFSESAIHCQVGLKRKVIVFLVHGDLNVSLGCASCLQTKQQRFLSIAFRGCRCLDLLEGTREIELIMIR